MTTYKNRKEIVSSPLFPSAPAQVENRDISAVSASETYFVKTDYLTLNKILEKLSGVWHALQDVLSAKRTEEEPIYETIKSQSIILAKLKVLLESLQEKLHKILNRKETFKVDSAKFTFVKDPTAQPKPYEKVMVDVAERNFEATGSLTDLNQLVTRLQNLIFILSGTIKNAEKVYYSEYGEELGASLTGSMAFAKSELDLARKKLEKFEAIKNESNIAEKSASLVKGISFFSKTENAVPKLEASEHQYANLEALKNFIK